MYGDIRSTSSSSSTGVKKLRKKKPYNDLSVHSQFLFPYEHDYIICVTAKYFLVFFVFPFEPLLVSFALLSYSICGFRRGSTCLRMIYKQRSLLSFVLVSIVERAQETFSVLVNVS